MYYISLRVSQHPWRTACLTWKGNKKKNWHQKSLRDWPGKFYCVTRKEKLFICLETQYFLAPYTWLFIKSVKVRKHMGKIKGTKWCCMLLVSCKDPLECLPKHKTKTHS